jgi:F5/8 type C domain.
MSLVISVTGYYFEEHIYHLAPGPKKDFSQFKITASSISPGMDPEYALDGERSKTKFYQSKEESGPWIKIDLLEEHLITSVIIYLPRVIETRDPTFSHTI